MPSESNCTWPVERFYNFHQAVYIRQDTLDPPTPDTKYLCYGCISNPTCRPLDCVRNVLLNAKYPDLDNSIVSRVPIFGVNGAFQRHEFDFTTPHVETCIREMPNQTVEFDLKRYLFPLLEAKRMWTEEEKREFRRKRLMEQRDEGFRFRILGRSRLLEREDEERRTLHEEKQTNEEDDRSGEEDDRDEEGDDRSDEDDSSDSDDDDDEDEDDADADDNGSLGCLYEHEDEDVDRVDEELKAHKARVDAKNDATMKFIRETEEQISECKFSDEENEEFEAEWAETMRRLEREVEEDIKAEEEEWCHRRLREAEDLWDSFVYLSNVW